MSEPIIQLANPDDAHLFEVGMGLERHPTRPRRLWQWLIRALQRARILRRTVIVGIDHEAGTITLDSIR
jgi:hypothetical protein